MAAAIPAIAAVGSLAGGAASIASANKPYAASPPGLEKASLPQAQIPMQSVKSDLSMPTLSAGNTAGSMSAAVPSLASSRDYNLMHLLSGLNGGLQ